MNTSQSYINGKATNTRKSQISANIGGKWYS